jgi:sugar phosphate isomerase/epimerase
MSAIAIGMCTTPDRVPDLAPGYDYLELSVSGTLIPLEDNATYAATLQELRALTPPIKAFNVFAPPQLRLVGPDVDWTKVEQYVTRAVSRAAELGGRTIVIGSGAARAVPEGFSRDKAWEQLARMINICADAAEPLGVTMAIEPLNHNETNLINSYLEGVKMAREIDRPGVRVLADLYHFEVDGEPLEDILQAPEWLAHVHVADTGRLYPGSGSYPLPRLFEILKDVSYRGGVSIECRWGDDLTGESARALDFLRSLAY